jgi:dTDP-4-dehydrorhamnose 3,5-epimerase|tara:strand:+ start:635 stop:1126 length:492 start_codon:yes stop_codon:yes gene_type:complete
MNKNIFKEIKIFQPEAYEDYRGELWTTYKKDEFPIELNFNHDKISTSRKNVIRGIHGDNKSWKLVTCLYGDLYFVVVDYRKESKTFLEWDWIILNDKNKKMVLLPPNFGNSFCVLSNYSIFMYKWSYEGSYADVDEQFSLKWNDPRLNINWPIKNPILSERDK